MLVRFLVLELLFQALSRYSKILVYTCISTIFCSRTVILQLLVVQVVWFLLQFLCLRCIARSAYVYKMAGETRSNLSFQSGLKFSNVKNKKNSLLQFFQIGLFFQNTQKSI